MSLVNFLRFVVREEFVYVWRCRWLLGRLRLPGPRDQNGIRKWNVKWSVISCQGGVWGPDAIVMRVMGYHILGAQIIDLLSSSSYYWSFYYLVRTLSPRWLSRVSSARHASPQSCLVSRHFIQPLTPITIDPYHHQHILGSQNWHHGY